MNYNFKRLLANDTSLLRQLLKVYGEAFFDVETYQGAVPSQEYLTNLLAGPGFIAVVALEGENVVGGLCAYELKKFERERSEIYIYDLAVEEKHRRQGIATNLILKLKEIAKEKKAYVIYVQADLGDEPAINLYTKLGTREDVHHFDILV